ncbi:hypothetical protein D3C77_650110 [compost metagenome]
MIGVRPKQLLAKAVADHSAILLRLPIPAKQLLPNQPDSMAVFLGAEKKFH